MDTAPAAESIVTPVWPSISTPPRGAFKLIASAVAFAVASRVMPPTSERRLIDVTAVERSACNSIVSVTPPLACK